MREKLDNLFKRFDEEFDKQYPSVRSYTNGHLQEYVKDFLHSALQEMAEDLKDDQSLEDESNGRYNREMELRQKLKDNWGIDLG